MRCTCFVDNLNLRTINSTITIHGCGCDVGPRFSLDSHGGYFLFGPGWLAAIFELPWARLIVGIYPLGIGIFQTGVKRKYKLGPTKKFPVQIFASLSRVYISSSSLKDAYPQGSDSYDQGNHSNPIEEDSRPRGGGAGSRH